ncbi:hypothetical protein FQN54_007247 [Arachnomyces sp. PD_36]|nr:hypothetical protein FQN54_007247 [Arachnomyces sp. PD_36]
MSFGISISDFLKLSDYALQVYKQCRDCTGQYQSLASETRQLSGILGDLADLVKGDKLGFSKRPELLQRGEGCLDVLVDLEAHLAKYNSLPTQSKRAWDMLTWDQQGGKDLRERLMSNVTMLNTFYSTLILSAQMRIQQALSQLQTDYQGGYRDASIVSTLDGCVDEETNEDGAWPQIIRDLEDLGISEELATQYQTFIVDWFVKAINEGLLQEQTRENTSLDNHSLLASGPYDLLQPTDSVSQSTLVSPTDHPDSQASSVETEVTEPPSFEANMLWRAERIVHHWDNHEWFEAEEHLLEQVQAVRAGEFAEIDGKMYRPDIRILHHLLGVATVLQGNYIRAKSFFECVMKGPYVSGGRLDEGDIAAARWLGDICICINEPQSAALAYTIALRGLVVRQSIFDDPAARVLRELFIVNYQLRGLSSLAHALQRSDIDSSTILQTTPNETKFQLVLWGLEQLPYAIQWLELPRRPGIGMGVTVRYLVQPLIRQGAWPLPYDEGFASAGAAACTRLMNEKIEMKRDGLGFTFMQRQLHLTQAANATVNSDRSELQPALVYETMEDNWDSLLQNTIHSEYCESFISTKTVSFKRRRPHQLRDCRRWFPTRPPISALLQMQRR